MIAKTLFIRTDDTYPYRNIALEKYLLEDCSEDECILYLWQNSNTVVIGKNQNCWKECRVSALEESGGHLARRLSGGGAVYHDMGNLNFTFLVHKDNYDVSKQLEVIIKALKLLGISVEKTGRNDMVADGRKFSGNAFYEHRNLCYHHGTLLIDTDVERMTELLSVNEDKLRSKGVSSVRSRVVNLRELCPEITVALVAEKLREAFDEVYGIKSEDYDTARLDREKLCEYEKEFSSWDWKYGRKLPFETELSKRFSWGDVSIQLEAERGIIKNARVFSDSMKHEWPSELEKLLAGCRYEKKAIQSVMSRMPADISHDLISLAEEFI